MKYPVITQIDANRLLESRWEGKPLDEDKLVTLRGEGPDRFDESVIDKVKSEIKKLMKNFPKELRPRDPSGGRFESDACQIVHKHLQLDMKIAADFDFWTWLAVVKLSDIVEWRHGGKDRLANPSNFGISNRKENLIYRMWMRAEIAYNPDGENGYELSKRGDIDLWRSHILRQSYANCRNLAKALVRYQYPDENPDKARLKIKKIRELAKRLRRLCANLFFETLDETLAFKYIEREAEAIE